MFSGCQDQQSSVVAKDPSDLPNPVYSGRCPSNSIGLRREHALNIVQLYLFQQTGDRFNDSGKRTNNFRNTSTERKSGCEFTKTPYANL